MGAELFEQKNGSEILTSEKVIEFLNSFQRPLVCQVCGNSQWVISAINELPVGEDKQEQLVIETIGYAQYIQEEDSAINYPGGMPVIRATCECCGHILLFSYKKVRALIESQALKLEAAKSE